MPSKVVPAYLLIYNVAQSVGWAIILVETISALWVQQKTGNEQNVYGEVGWLVGRCQGLAFLEVLHAGLGFVRGSPATAFLQWFGRSNVLFGILKFVPQVQNRWPIPALFIAWSLAEVIRYPWYAIVLVRSEAPYFLTWLRYTMFIPLYPVGIASEIAIIWRSLPILKETSLHSVALPNKANFAFSYYTFNLVGIFVLYPVLFPYLLTTMLQQRQRKLGRPKTA